MQNEVKQIYSRNLKTIDEKSTLAEAEELMNAYRIRHLPVVNKEFVLRGILSKSDYSALKNIHTDLSKLIVRDFMSSPVKSISATATIKQVAQLFLHAKISSVMIIDRDEAVGIVTTEDLLRILAERADPQAEEDIDLATLAEEGWISSTAMI